MTFTEFVRTPFSVPGIKDGKWYVEMKSGNVSISGHSFKTKLADSKKLGSRRVVSIQKIIDSKLSELARDRKNIEKDIKELTLLAPYKVETWVRRVLPKFSDTVTEALKEALAELKFAVKKVPTSSLMMKKVARLSNLLGEKDKAISTYMQSMAFDKNDLEALMGISNLFFDKKNYVNSIKYFDKYLTLNLKIRHSRIKPKIQVFLENDGDAGDMLSELGWKAVEDFTVELVRKRQWAAASGLIKKLYAFKKIDIAKKITEAKKNNSDNVHNVLLFKVSELVPPVFEPILKRLSLFDVSKLLEFSGYQAYRTASYIGNTGVMTPTNIMVRSAGHFEFKNRIYGKYDNIIIGKRDVSSHRVGYNMAVLDQKSGKVLQRKNFNTAFDKKSSAKMIAFVNKIKEGRIVVVSSREEASENLNKGAEKALSLIGSGQSMLKKYRWAHALIGVKGAKPGTALEMLSVYPASVTIYKKNSKYTIKNILENSNAVIRKMKIRRKTLFLLDIQPDSNLLLVLP